MARVTDVARKKFTLEEARALLPQLREITEQAADELSRLAQTLQTLEEGDTRRAVVEQEYLDRLNEWAEEVQEAGAEVKGMFLIDFDNGEGYYCWKWPEREVEHFHGYEEGFAGRMRIN